MKLRGVHSKVLFNCLVKEVWSGICKLNRDVHLREETPILLTVSF